MKILSFMNPIKFGGGERLMVELGDYFRSQQIAFSVVNLNRSPEFEENLGVHRIPFLNLSDVHFKQTPRKAEYVVLALRLLKYIPAIARTVSVEAPDCVLANGFPTIVLVAAALFFWRKRPKMIYVHHFMKARENRLVGFAYRLVLNRYDKIVAVSSLNRDLLVENFPELKKKITFVPNGVDCKRFDVAGDRTSLRKKFNLPDGVLAISVGRLTAFKNHKVLIELAKKVNQKDFHIVIAGVGDERDNLFKMIEDYGLKGSVELLGEVDSEKLPYYLKAADMFLFPSLKEGFPLAVIEAMAAGLPVVIFNNIYTKEFGNDLFVAKDVPEFESMAKRLIEDAALRKTAGIATRKYAMDHLDISVTGKKFIETIR